MNPERQKSNCCNAPYKPDVGDEGTGCYVCSKCGKPMFDIPQSKNLTPPVIMVKPTDTFSTRLESATVEITEKDFEPLCIGDGTRAFQLAQQMVAQALKPYQDAKAELPSWEEAKKAHRKLCEYDIPQFASADLAGFERCYGWLTKIATSIINRKNEEIKNMGLDGQIQNGEHEIIVEELQKQIASLKEENEQVKKSNIEFSKMNSDLAEIILKQDGTIEDLKEELTQKDVRIQQLETLMNSPELDNFIEGIKTESAHQTERWGKKNEEQNPPHHYVMVNNKLLGKLCVAIWDRDINKFKHHLITIASVMYNCHRQIENKDTFIHEWFKPETEKKV